MFVASLVEFGALPQRVFVALACAVLVSCVSARAAPRLPQPYDTKYDFRLVSPTLMDEYASERMFWIDDHRLVFRADEYENGKKVEAKRIGLYLWDERDRSLRRLEDVAIGVCYTDGVLSYVTRRGDRRLYLEGPIGAMKETPLASDVQQPPRVRCRAVPPGTVPPKTYALLGGGFLEDRRGSPGGALPYRYYRDLNAAPIELPINPLFTGVSLHRYSEFTGSHIFKSSYFDRTSKTTAVLQILSDGSIHKIGLTDGPWSQGVRVPLPTAQGWLLGTARQGVYLMNDDGVEKISPGQVLDIAVSPNGCRAALKMHFGTGSSIRPKPVYLVDLCEEGVRK